ncbi:nicotinate-nucleotide--dimethylbenzimidazole phosphoribosyltransferase [Thiorhodovibrio frisius]|uniref:Nicotinate-nucleotide--dimethylbenzimidazole phosphoribosyltransferase n=1 Tax=Thiorhodovibrio frisius TaxID=631362 RepID=H8Z407_9GAMM|nr:nicotinate-nucleotide--dimethylbenzimidazole phosphoribosyltransferase [Thiorhodovibrio frisius]EIC20076.1 nicotinate-nucleotide--dimethylbenzimidazole phosphoribosyltransferase [Thiorhodovibrio frisius]
MEWLGIAAVQPSTKHRKGAEARQDQLTKPPGSLGRLEHLACQLAELQARERPQVERIQIVVFAGDHGIARAGVSAFPQEVTAAMVRNFAAGGAAISVLAKQLGAEFEVVNLGTVIDPGPLPGVKDYRLGPGTASFDEHPAMTEHQLACALGAGRHAVERAHLQGCELFIGGEMGIGNTTSAAAIACALLGQPAEILAGPGTGLDLAGVARKTAVIASALRQHREACASPLETLRCLGGFEIAALAGAYVACAQIGLPVVIDGFISSAAALTATRLCLGAEKWFLFSHNSAEPGHRLMLEAMHAKPLLDIGMRLGEGSGAAMAVPMLRMACALHNDMATFAEAEVASSRQPADA